MLGLLLTHSGKIGCTYFFFPKSSGPHSVSSNRNETVTAVKEEQSHSYLHEIIFKNDNTKLGEGRKWEVDLRGVRERYRGWIWSRYSVRNSQVINKSCIWKRELKNTNCKSLRTDEFCKTFIHEINISTNRFSIMKYWVTWERKS